MPKINVYACNKNGGGFVQKIGEYKNVEDIKLRAGMFAKDVVLSFEEEYDEKIKTPDIQENKQDECCKF